MSIGAIATAARTHSASKANGNESSWDSARSNARSVRAALMEADDGSLVSSARLLARALAAAALDCYLVPHDDTLLSGAHAVLDPEAHAVWVRDDAKPGESAVYIAHEIAHFHLHENGAPCECSEADFADADAIVAVGYGPRQRRETEANVWAREFLLPSALAQHLFYDEGLDAHAISERLGLPLGLVFGQLAEALCAPGQSEPATDIVAPPLSEPGAAPKWPLDPSQAAAAFAERGPLLVGAGPGTGKTRTLTERVLYLTRERGVRPENLLALTFSRKAAEEMRERIALEAPEIARRASISTFHAFGLDLLRRHGAAIGLPPVPVLLDLSDACALLEKNIGSFHLTALRYLHDPAYPLPEILRTIGHAKEDLITPEMFRYRAEASDDPKLIDVAKVYVHYERLLRAKGAIDFSDLIYRALMLLQDNPEVRRAEQAQWQEILVDEYQDVNRAGALLVQALAGGDAPGLWAVGDLRQAIYRFRGASPANVTRFQTDFPQGRRLELSVNYRSRPPLVRLFGEASGEGSSMWQASRADTTDYAAEASLCVADDDLAQADGIARKMRRFCDLGYTWSDQVVLCRTRGQARALRERLSERGIPVAQGPENYSPLGARDVRDLIALLSRASELGSAARHLYPELPQGMDGFSRGDAYDFWTEALWGKAGLVRDLHEPLSIVPLLTLARSFRDRKSVFVDDREDSRRAFLQHVRRLKRLGMPLGAPEAIDVSGSDELRIMTVHASKGLEFPVVFVPNLSAGKFPTRPMPSLIPPLPADENSPNEDSDSAEEERLFFVALTRARDHLVVSRAIKYGNISAKASPLLDLIEDSSEMRHEVWERSDDFAPDPLPEDWDEETRDVSDETGSQEAIDSRDADLYLRCPRRYYYQRVLKAPGGERSPYSAFKSAVSEALSTPDPESALDAVWALRGPDPGDPQSAFYRAAAQEILERSKDALLPVASGAPTFTIALPNGQMTVAADAATAGGSAEFRTFRKPPTEETVLSADRRQGLLQEAVQRQSGRPPTLQMRYLQNGDTRPIADKPKQRVKQLAEYDRALRGIRLRVFPPVPADEGDCAGCPYLFICPD